MPSVMQIERKRATQIAMPYAGMPAAARPHLPPTMSNAQAQVAGGR